MKNSKLSQRLLSFLLLAALLASSYPVVTAVEDVVLYEGATEYILSKGDLPLAELANKTLPAAELPEIIDPEVARENKNVHRLYEQETDFNSVVFQNNNGSKTMYYFGDAVKYVDANGNVKDKSNKLYQEKNGLVNSDNDIKAYFPNTLGESSGVVLTADNFAIEMYPLHHDDMAFSDKTAKKTQQAEQKGNNFVFYKESFGAGSALRYTPTYTGVKEDIILDRDIGLYDFSFLVSAKGLRAVSDGKAVQLYDDAGDAVVSFSDIVIYDSAAEKNITLDSTVSIKETGTPGEFIYTIHAAKDFLQNEETVYPVFIDPTITINTSGSGTSKTIIDNPIYSGLFTSCAGANLYNVVGYAGLAGNGYGVGRTLMKFPGLMSNSTFNSIQASQITSLSLNIHEISGKSTSTTIYANLYTGAAWNETSTTYSNVTWNGYGILLNSKTFTAGNNAWVQFDLTSAVSTWKNSSTTADKGIMLRNSNESADANRRDFRSTENSSNKPYVVMTYNYYGDMAYRQDNRTTVNCHGYAMNRNDFPEGWYTTADKAYVSTVSTSIEQCIARFAERFQTWLTANNYNWRAITKNSELNAGEYRVIMRFGRSYYPDGEVSSWDYHFWYQTKNGSWASKSGKFPSQNLASNITPDSVYPSHTGWSKLNNDGTVYKGDFYTGPIYYFAIMP